jgi:DNA-binding winged helix-turn-helix (wHTH) protein/tetratricopeptide (TPR) repeat protein
MDRPAAWRSFAIDLEMERPFRIGAADVDPISREADFPGGTERLQPQPLKVLVALVRRKNHVVTRSELIDSCWQGRIVGEDVINHAISLLRGFAERAGGFEIETVPKTGYRLAETARNRRSRPAILVAVLIVAAAGLGALLLRVGARQAAPAVPTIAILPFDQRAGDQRSAEFAAETRNFLAHMLSEGGFPVELASGPSAAAQRNSDIIISGDVRRRLDNFEATIRIERSAPRVIIYSQQFDSAGVESRVLPERIGAQVAAALSWTMPLMILDRRYPTDPAITADLFRKSALTVQGREPLQVYEISHRLSLKAPGSPLVQTGLAFDTALALDAIPRDQREKALVEGRQAAERAVALAPEFGDVYGAWCLLHSPVRSRECEDRLRHGMAIDPDAPFLSSFLGHLLESVGRFDEGLELAREALANDRYKLKKITRLLRELEIRGRTTEAEQLYRQANRWWPDHSELIWSRWSGMLARGDFDAIQRFEDGLGPDALPANHRAPTRLFAAIRSGKLAEAKQLCADNPSSADMLCMAGLARLGDIDGAFAFADRLYPDLRGRTQTEEDSRWFDSSGGAPLFLLASPSAAALRRDPRFLAIADRGRPARLLAQRTRAGFLPAASSRTGLPEAARPGLTQSLWRGRQSTGKNASIIIYPLALDSS